MLFQMLKWSGAYNRLNANSQRIKQVYSLGSRTIKTNISSYLMVHDFSETILCNAILNTKPSFLTI